MDSWLTANYTICDVQRAAGMNQINNLSLEQHTVIGIAGMQISALVCS